MITLVNQNEDGTFTIRIDNEPEKITLTDEQFDELLRETLAEEYPDMVKQQDEI